jgi:hypothetical protein
MLGCLVIGTWLLFDFVNRTDHVRKKEKDLEILIWKLF